MGKLYESYFDRIFAYLRSALGSAADAEDLTQQVFVSGLQGLARFDPDRGPFRAWLFKIARNELIDFHRRRARVDVLEPREITGHLERNHFAPDPFEPVSGHPLTGLLSRLTDRQRQVIVLRFGCELTTAEIAAVLGISEQAVYQAHHRALERLSRHLEASRPARVLRVSMVRRERHLRVLAARRMPIPGSA